MDGNKLAVDAEGQCFIWNPKDNEVEEELKISFSKYIENIRDGILGRKINYEGPDCGLVSSCWF